MLSTRYDHIESNAKLSYQALADCHNTFVESRFSVASLYMTASAFLVGAYFLNPNEWTQNRYWIPILGIFITITAWLLELRAEALQSSFIKQGLAIERTLIIPSHLGFFSLLVNKKKQGIRVPFFNARLKNSTSIESYFFTHKFGLELMYTVFLFFWLFISIEIWIYSGNNSYTNVISVKKDNLENDKDSLIVKRNADFFEKKDQTPFANRDLYSRDLNQKRAHVQKKKMISGKQ